MMLKRVLPCVAVGLALALGACREPAAVPPDAGRPAAPDAGAGQAAVVAVGRTSVKSAPDDKAKVVTLLNRGERVTALDKGDPYVKVQLSDGEAGYVLAKNLLLGQVTEATLTRDQDFYTRPDALSPVKKRLPVGTLLFVLQEKDGWSLVQALDRFQGWVPTDKAVVDFPDVEAARALWKVELLLEQKKPEMAVQLLRDCLGANPGSKLVQMVEARLATLPVPDAGLLAGDAGAAASSSSAGTSSSASAGAPDAGRPRGPTLVVPEFPSPGGDGSGAAPDVAAATSGPRPTMVMP